MILSSIPILHPSRFPHSALQGNPVSAAGTRRADRHNNVPVCRTRPGRGGNGILVPHPMQPDPGHRFRKNAPGSDLRRRRPSQSKSVPPPYLQFRCYGRKTDIPENGNVLPGELRPAPEWNRRPVPPLHLLRRRTRPSQALRRSHCPYRLQYGESRLVIVWLLYDAPAEQWFFLLQDRPAGVGPLLPLHPVFPDLPGLPKEPRHHRHS